MTTPETADLDQLFRDHYRAVLRYVVRRAGDRDRELVVALTDLYTGPCRSPAI
ncbi:hypothetical protein OG555_07060 [Kribbella sp. NBC_01484]|uniref:hypothetical protein n=1 Tax=Kribbella sp. NBC_01484 TaxID=2903579 RepID=UPI002E32F1F1|nr:hypothetical protein [Kribbella sp. NBC_01484]